MSVSVKDSTAAEARAYLGSQVWLEHDDTAERVDDLFAKAAKVGLGWARLFLPWPWLQPRRDTAVADWNWALWDRGFDAAQRHGLRLKVTLTANSGPWWWGTPSALHTHTGILTGDQWAPSEAYVRAVAARYAGHPALAQWILWNEPFEEDWDCPAYRAFWNPWLERRYGGDLDALNASWRTGYDSFDAIPHAEEVPAPVHRLSCWNSSFPFLDHLACRQAWLMHQLTRVRDWVRAEDADTPVCVNPTYIHANRLAGGTSLPAMAGLVDVLGASFHPSWHFTFAERADYAGLVAAGVSTLRAVPGVREVETTELQTGNTTDSGVVPNDAGPDAVARTHLAALAAGSTSVTGWCFNSRRDDNEAGDWGLLDDLDRVGDRARSLQRVADTLQRVLDRHGPLRAARPTAWVGTEAATQAYEVVHARSEVVNTAGRHVDDSAQGAAMLCVELGRLGLPAAPVALDALAGRVEAGDVVVLSHLSVYDAADVAPLVERVRAGAVLVLDATTGRRDPALAMARPWPNALAEAVGLTTTGTESRTPGWDVRTADGAAGFGILCRSKLEAGAGAWQALPSPRFDDGEPVVLTRALGDGRVFHVRCPLGPSLLHTPVAPWRACLRGVLQAAGVTRPGLGVEVTDRDDVTVIPMHAGGADLTLLLAPEACTVRVRSASPLTHEHWRDVAVEPPVLGEQRVVLENGVGWVSGPG